MRMRTPVTDISNSVNSAKSDRNTWKWRSLVNQNEEELTVMIFGGVWYGREKFSAINITLLLKI